MPDLKLDLDAMEETGSRLSTLRDEFLATEEFNRGLSDATGHGRLGGTIGDFASAWNIRREEIGEEIQVVMDATQAICDTFRELDAALAEHISSVEY
ncbi:hypothetical protein NKG05_14880 [Oerskovia sp. M15]